MKVKDLVLASVEGKFLVFDKGQIFRMTRQTLLEFKKNRDIDLFYPTCDIELGLCLSMILMDDDKQMH